MNNGAGWRFLTNHARVLLFIAVQPGARLRDIAGELDVTERTAHGVVADLTESGYLVKEKDSDDGRRNRYRIESRLPWRETIGRERTIGEVLDLLVHSPPGKQKKRSRR